jgi:prevent-host-death family protein
MPERKPSANRKAELGQAAELASAALPAWTLEDAKSRFNEVVRLAHDKGPQGVAVHGWDAAVVLSAADYARLAQATTGGSLAALFSDGAFARLDALEESLGRERGAVRDAPEFDA